jgi:hypothetical protein
MPDTMLFAWMGDDVEAILLVFAVMIAVVAIVVVLDLKQRGLPQISARSWNHIASSSAGCLM